MPLSVWYSSDADLNEELCVPANYKIPVALYRPSHPGFFDHLMSCTCNYETSTWLESLHGNQASNETGQSCTKFLGVWLLNVLSWSALHCLEVENTPSTKHACRICILKYMVLKMLYKRSCDPELTQWEGVTQDAIHIACKALSPTPRGPARNWVSPRQGRW